MSSIGAIAILHGPGLAPAKPQPGAKRRPCTWAITARMQAATVDALERLARVNGCHRGDIVRTAVVEFLEKHTNADSEHAHNDTTSIPSLSQPRLASPYTGSGGSDQSALKASVTRQNQRKQQGNSGERLIDKASSR